MSVYKPVCDRTVSKKMFKNNIFIFVSSHKRWTNENEMTNNNNNKCPQRGGIKIRTLRW